MYLLTYKNHKRAGKIIKCNIIEFRNIYLVAVKTMNDHQNPYPVPFKNCFGN